MNATKRTSSAARCAWTLEQHRAWCAEREAQLRAADPAALVKRIERAANGLSNGARRGRRVDGSLDAIDRFQEMREALHATLAGELAWQAWCRSRGFAFTHDAYDYFA